MIQYTNVSSSYNQILLRGVDLETGEPVIEERDYSPSYYIPTTAESPFVNFPEKNNKLEKREFDHHGSYKEFYQELRKSGSIFGRARIEANFINDEMKDRSDYDTTNIRRMILDIEVHADEFPKPEEAKFPVDALTVFDSFTKKIHVFHCKQDWKLEDCELLEDPDLEHFNLKENVVEHFCATEKKLLLAFVKFWVNNYPDVVSGWNSDNFDMRYFFYRIPKVCGQKYLDMMSPFNNVYTKKKNSKFGKEEVVVFQGISSLDYLKLYQKNTFKKRENYKLDTIAHVELKTNKLSYEEYENLHELSDKNPQKYVDYNIKDVLLIENLDRKLGIFDLVFDIAYLAGINFDDTGSPVNVWDNLVHNHLEDQNIIPVMFPSVAEKEKLEGAFVRPTLIGSHKWVVSFDLASLYPSIIRQWNIGPDTKMYVPGFQRDNFVTKIIDCKVDSEKAGQLTEVLKENNCCLAANGILYTNEFEGCFKFLMNQLYTERKRSKKLAGDYKQEGKKDLAKKFNTRQMALKILLNSGYGALANLYFRFSDIELAESITLTGQLVSHWIFDEINRYMNKMVGTSDVDYIIAGDTDSVYISFERFVNKFCKSKDEDKITEFLDKSAKVFETKCIAPGYERLKELLNCQESLMIMDREAIGSHAFWRKKKNYAIRVKDMEGWRPEEPEYKILGLEAIKSTFNEKDRNAMTKAVKMILDPKYGNDDLLKFIDEYHEEYMARTIEEIASVSRVNYIERYSDSKGNCLKGCPKNSRAAIVYNRMIKKLGLDNRYPTVKEGDSIYIIELKDPNPFRESVVGFLDFLPREFEIDDYVDREGLFNTNFYNPVSTFCKAVQWKYDDTPDLASFF